MSTNVTLRMTMALRASANGISSEFKIQEKTKLIDSI